MMYLASLRTANKDSMSGKQGGNVRVASNERKSRLD